MRFVFTLILAAGLWLVQAPARAAGPPPPLKFGLWFAMGSSQAAQFKAAFNDSLKLFQTHLGRPVTPVFFNAAGELQTAASQNRLDFYFATAEERQPGYTPLVSATLYGMSHTRLCLYTSQNSTAQKAADLKGQNAIINDNPLIFYSLWRLTGQNPVVFFRSLKSTREVFGAFLALSLSNVQAAYATEAEFHHLKRTNPGAVNKLRAVWCDHDRFPFPPIFVSSRLPAPLVAKARTFFLSFHEKKTKSQFDPLFRLLKLRFKPYDPADFQSIAALQTLARNKGWVGEFTLWRRRANR